MPAEIRRYLNGRGIPDQKIDEHLLGWSGSRITIPIFDRRGNVSQFRYAKSPTDKSDSPKVLTEVGGAAELYGWDTLAKQPLRVVICEGEFDRLVLEARGFQAVTSTAGAQTFCPEWVPHFDAVKYVYVCFDRDDAGERAARNVKALIPRGKIVRLPADVGPKGDVTDYFIRLGNGIADFEVLLAIAATAKEDGLERLNAASPPSPHKSVARRAEKLKQRIPLARVVGRYIELRPAGGKLVGLCAFHDERSPSFTLYPATDTYYCFGCGAHGDVIAFLMRKESMTFGQALHALERFLHTNDL